MTYEGLMERAREVQRMAVAVAQAGLGTDAARRAAVEREFADVPDAFRAIGGFPDPGRFASLAAEVDCVLRGLSTGDGVDRPANVELARIGGTAASLHLWTGSAAERFRQNFLEPWPAFVRNQYAVGVVLHRAVVAQAEIWARARDDAEQIAERALQALAACKECTRTEWTVTFTVMASVAAVVAVPLTGGASLAASGVAAVAQVLAATPPGEAPQTSFSADDPFEVVERVREAIRMLLGHVRERLDAVAGALGDTSRTVSDRPELFGWQ
ncbi:hypothetical protein [Dactylosporangium salmoneum]